MAGESRAYPALADAKAEDARRLFASHELMARGLAEGREVRDAGRVGRDNLENFARRNALDRLACA